MQTVILGDGGPDNIRQALKRINDNFTELNATIQAGAMEVVSIGDVSVDTLNGAMRSINANLDLLFAATGGTGRMTHKIGDGGPDNIRKTLERVVTNQNTVEAAFASMLLARIDFQAGSYTVGGVSKTLGQVITGGTFNPASINASDGWFPSDDEYGFFGSALLPVIGRANGFCAVIHSAGQASRPQNITLTFANDAFSVAVTGVFHAGTIGALQMNDALSDPLITPINTSGVLGAAKHAIRITPTQFAGQITTTSETSLAPGVGQFGTWGSQSFVEAGQSSYKIYSIEFWAPGKSLADLVAL